MPNSVRVLETMNRYSHSPSMSASMSILIEMNAYIKELVVC